MGNFSLFAVFAVGFLGGVHCLGMCGSIVGIFSAQIPKEKARPAFHLAYNGGRLASYAAAGALVGAIGQAGLLLRDVVPIQHLLFALSSLMLIMLGLYLAGVWSIVRRIEKAGGVLWKRIQPLTQSLLPVNSPRRAMLLGLLLGWLPCGLVYSVLVTALASGSAAKGAMIMLAFGVGTLPNLLAIGMFWESLKKWAQARGVRVVAGMLVAGFGVYGLFKVGYTFYMYGWTGSCHVEA